ncbi:uncharacterized protein LOC121237637 isoform X1 [Juglans microcarpa x Juglans regia]|uniref:uncharacterized protein LOC121237637 isoform X1 n=1 Tax=Juglans microcarpa x Juglans regia TaxID=2249226 RepID=UPI001B7E742F|nr:uncharacterized protein LOC121237637 isoform X1 [Juglans microcarpa x Juglans regia]
MVEFPPPSAAAVDSYSPKLSMNSLGGSSPLLEVQVQLEDHLESIGYTDSAEAPTLGAEGVGMEVTDVGLLGSEILIVPETQFSSSDVVVEWEGKKLFGEEERGVTPTLQWASSEGERIPLNRLLPNELTTSDWMLQKMKDLQHLTGMDCVGYEEQCLVLLIAIEAGHA